MGSFNDFKTAFCKTFFCDTLDFVCLFSDLCLLGEEALDPLLEPGFELDLVEALAESLLPFSFFPDPILFFLEDESVGVLEEFSFEFCLFNFPGTD